MRCLILTLCLSAATVLCIAPGCKQETPTPPTMPAMEPRMPEPTPPEPVPPLQDDASVAPTPIEPDPTAPLMPPRDDETKVPDGTTP
jgi:hypothetical protein